MKLAVWLLIVLSAAGPATAQQSGVSAEWDIRKTLESLGTQVRRLQPMLEQLRPADWVAAGAPATYTQQWNSAKTQVESIGLSVAALSRQPEKLTASLDTMFRLQSLETTLSSLIEGIRRYQNPALADLLAGVMSESSNSAQQLRQYVTDLAALKEQEFQVVEQEAQRCRTTVSRQPAPKPAAPRPAPQK